MENAHHWLQLRNMQRMEERVKVRLRRRVIRDRNNPFEDLAEEEFLLRFRLSKECVLNLLENIRGQLPIAADARGCPIPQHLQLLIALRCMATGGHQLTISDCYEVSQTSISKCLRTVTPIIAQMARDYVKMPTDANVIRVMERFREIAGMPGIVGAIDCTHIHILRPTCANPELYRNRKGIFSLNCQAVCGPDLTFFNIVARWWGSAHDSNIFNNSLLRHEFEQGMHRGKLLGDMGYPCRNYLFTPLMNPSNNRETAYNEAHIKTRNKIECAFVVLKRRFSCLGKRMYTALDTTKSIIVAAVVLHNFAIQRNVPLPNDLVESNDAGDLNIFDNAVDPEAVIVNDNAAQTERNRYIRTYF